MSVEEAGSHARPLVLALDAMGGDNAPDAVIRGADLFLTWHPQVHFRIFGNKQAIQPLLDTLPALHAVSELIHTDDDVTNDDKPSHALRRRRNSSMRLAIDAVAEGRAAGVISSGNTGALMAMAKLVLKSLPGIDRPAIVTTVPTTRGKCVVLDLGANVECSAQNLFQFAVMGDAFARSVLGIESPTIGLLNIGSEELKGREDIKLAAEMLRNTSLPLNFKGYVEGDKILDGKVDVIVTDGFTGNVALKSMEGTAKVFRHFVKEAVQQSLLAKIGALLAQGAFRKLAMKLDPRSHNGAMFIGVNGVAVKSHGGADYKAFANALEVAYGLATHQVNARIIEEMRQYEERMEIASAKRPAVQEEV
ncbi:MAG: phosphate acyltransferase [Rickettsiales bacterium]|nr:phosphate acyltransferase [Rickettsiales bacterium]